MAQRSEIEWTDATGNPVTGSTKVSPGCKHCYAETFAERFRSHRDAAARDHDVDLEKCSRRRSPGLCGGAIREGIDGGKARDVALGEVVFSILSAIRPSEAGPSDHVFIGKRGKPIRDVGGGFDSAVLTVWKSANPDEDKPRFHDLRKTSATRVEAVSSHAVAKRLLGHADEDVTASYVEPSLDDLRDAVNRAARSIDGHIPPGAIPFPARNVTPDVIPIL